MANKKYKNVKIINEELRPTAIGEVSSKKKSLIPLFIIIAVFLAFTYFLPDIAAYVENGYSFEEVPVANPNNVATPSEGSGNLDDGIEEDDENKYMYSENGEIVLEEFSLRNILVTDTILSFTMNSQTDRDIIDLNLYLDVYSSNNTLLYRLRLSDDMIGSYDIKDIDISYFEINEILEDMYPEVTLTEDVLTCSKDNLNIQYTFSNNELVKIYQTENFSNTLTSYNSDIVTYADKADSLGSLEGVNAITKSSDTGFDFIVEVDFAVYSESVLEIDHFYNKNTSPNVIKFELETIGDNISCR